MKKEFLGRILESTLEQRRDKDSGVQLSGTRHLQKALGSRKCSKISLSCLGWNENTPTVCVLGLNP